MNDGMSARPGRPGLTPRAVANRPRRAAGARAARWAVVALAVGCAWALPAHAGEVTVAVASNFTATMGVIGEAFTRATGHTLKLSAGPTGRLYSQIRAGAPFDVLIAADDEAPRQLVAEGHAIGASRFTYAVGQLVLWSAQPGLVDAKGAVLASGRFEHLAVANPRLAPYGRAAMEVLRGQGLGPSLKRRLVTAESVAQAYQFVFSGNAQLGFVALSQVAVPGRPTMGSMWRVPQSMYSPIRQDAVLLRRGQDNPAAAALLAYLKQAPAKAVIQAHGYAL